MTMAALRARELLLRLSTQPLRPTPVLNCEVGVGSLVICGPAWCGTPLAICPRLRALRTPALTVCPGLSTLRVPLVVCPGSRAIYAVAVLARPLNIIAILVKAAHCGLGVRQRPLIRGKMKIDRVERKRATKSGARERLNGDRSFWVLAVQLHVGGNP